MLAPDITCDLCRARSDDIWFTQDGEVLCDVCFHLVWRSLKGVREPGAEQGPGPLTPHTQQGQPLGSNGTT